MRLKERFIQKMSMMAVITALSMVFFACEDDENGKVPQVKVSEGFFISVTGENDEAEYIMVVEDIASGVKNISENLKELESAGYTWIFNSNYSTAIGLIYNQGEPGLGLGYGADMNGYLNTAREFRITSRFTSYGFFNKYALTSVGGQVPLDSNGQSLTHGDGTERTDGVIFNFLDLNTMSLTDKSITTLNITGNGDQATTSGIVDMGNGEFLTGLVVSQAIDESATGGSSSGTVNYPDSVWVAALDADLNVKRIYRSDKISYSSGRYRSQYYSQIEKAGDGTVYVFSGSYDSNTTRPCGALRIKSGAEDFDDYYFDIEALTEGYRFRKVWNITGDYFLLEFYNEAGPVTTTLAAASQYGIVHVTNKTFQWLRTGFPAKDEIVATGLPLAYKGKIYFPVTAGKDDATIYVIDPETATASKGLVISGGETIRAIGRLVN